MKTVLMALVLCISMGNLCAQKTDKKKPDYYKKGELQLGIDPHFGAGFTGGSMTRLRNLKFSASGGIFLADKFMVGVRGDFSYQNFIIINNRLTKGINLTGGVFSRYYFTRGKFSPFVELGAGRSQNIATGSFEQNRGSFYGEARVGMAYRLSKKVSFEASYFRKQFESNSFIPSPKGGMKLGINFHF